MDASLLSNTGSVDLTTVLKVITVHLLAWTIFGWLATYFPIRPVLKWSAKKFLCEEVHITGGSMVGILERILYMITISSGVYGFVAVWLIFKGAVKWKSSGENANARQSFNQYSIGTAVSLIVSIVGAAAIKLALQIWC